MVIIGGSGGRGEPQQGGSGDDTSLLPEVKTVDGYQGAYRLVPMDTEGASYLTARGPSAQSLPYKH